MNIAVHQNHAEEQKRESEFWALQEDILQEFGQASPEPPRLEVRYTLSLISGSLTFCRCATGSELITIRPSQISIVGRIHLAGSVGRWSLHE